MNDFITRHQDRVIGTLEGGDRLVFRGTLRQLSYGDGLGAYLGYRKVLRQKWGVFCPQVTAVVDRQAKRIAQEAGRPYQYVASAKVRKEDLLGGWLGKGGLLAGRAGSYGTRRQSA